MTQDKHSDRNFTGTRQRMERAVTDKAHYIPNVSALSLEELQQRIGELDVYQSELEKQNEELRENERRYRDLVENVEDLICEHDLEGNLIFVNSPAASLSGYDSADLIGTNLRSYFEPEMRHQFDEYLASIQKDGRAKGLMRVQTKDGEKRIWEYRNMLRRGIADAPTVLGIARDVTESTKAEKLLRQAERRYRHLFDSAPLMYIITRNQQGVPFISDCNECFVRSVGYKREEVLGQPLTTFYTPKSCSDLLEAGYARSLAGEFFIGERELLARDGRLIPTLL